MSLCNGRTLGICSAVLGILLAIPAVAKAHAIGAEARLKDGRVNVEAFYDDNTPAENAKVVVTDSEGTVVAEGKTDTSGKWSFLAPPAGKYKVAVDAGAGHRATVALTIPNAAPLRTPSEKIADTGPIHSSATQTSETITNEEITVSEGLTRSEFTGWQRFALAALGLVVIGGGTWTLTRLLRVVKGRQERMVEISDGR